MSNWNLNGKRALVSGGTKGIGRAVVEEFTQLGASVIFTARDVVTINEMEREFQEKGMEVYGLVADASSPTDREKLVEFVQNKWESLDILVNNAGTNIRKETINYSDQEYRKIFETNFFSAFELCRLCHAWLRSSQNASIINIASVAGEFNVGTGSPYASSKAAMIQLSRHLAVEWAKDGIRVNTVSPWFTVTPLTEGYLANLEKLKQIVDRTPMGRIAQPQEVAGAVAFFAMDKASYISGQHLMTDGGVTSGIF